MHISEAGRVFIEEFEGLSLKAYWDSAGRVWTIGYGHTSVAGSPTVHKGMVITKDQADKILASDLLAVEFEIEHFIKRELTQWQFDALGSFQFNLGWLGRSTCSLTKAINAGNLRLADEDFQLYDEAGGHVLPGLVRRRHGEALMFAGSVEEALQVAGYRGPPLENVQVPVEPPAPVAEQADPLHTELAAFLTAVEGEISKFKSLVGSL